MGWGGGVKYCSLCLKNDISEVFIKFKAFRNCTDLIEKTTEIIS